MLDLWNSNPQVNSSNIHGGSAIKKAKPITKKSSKKSSTRRFSEWREEDNNNSNIDSVGESMDKSKAPLPLQHRIDVIRATKKPILQHLIKMNIEPFIGGIYFIKNLNFL